MAFVGTVSPAVPLTNRNLIINGAMQVAQRGTSETGVTTSGYKNACDRYRCNGNNGTWTISQDTDAPEGFSNSFKMLLTATEVLGNIDYWAVEQKIEGQNLQHLKYGTASAQSVTLSFWVKSNVTGTYCANLYQDDGASNYPVTYTIDAADTWEYKTIVYDGNTVTSLDNDNASSLRATFFVLAGSDYTSGATGSRTAYANATFAAGHAVNVGSAVNNYFQITGVQLEVGDTATPFEHRSYGDELARCQRYYYRMTSTALYGRYGLGENTSTSGMQFPVVFSPILRATPSFSYGGALSAYRIYHKSGFYGVNSITIDSQATPKIAMVNFGSSSTGLTSGGASQGISYNSLDTYLEFDAEL